MQNSFNIKPIISLLLILIIGFTLIVVMGSVLIPFLVALILAYIFNPLVEKINKKFKIKRSVISFIISILIFIIFLSIPFFMIPTIAIQLKMIIVKIPDLIHLFNSNVLGIVNAKYGTNLSLDFDNLKGILLNNVGQVYNNVNMFSPLAKNSFIIVEIILYTVLIPFILFFAINNWHKILHFLDKLIPRGYLDTTHLIIHDIDIMMSAYLRGQLSVMLIMAFYYGISLHFIDLTSGAIIGILTGLLVFVPYLGIFTGFVISICVGFAGFTGMHQIFAILIVFGIGHLLEGGLVTPFLVGGKIGLNPVMIILALMIFGKALGLIGILLALPLSTIAVVLLKYAKLYYIHSHYYNDK